VPHLRQPVSVCTDGSRSTLDNGSTCTSFSVKESSHAALAHGLLLEGTMRTTTLFLYVGLLALVGSAARATDSVDPALIRSAAEHAVRAQAGAGIGQLMLEAAPLDPRLRVAVCDEPLKGFVSGTGEVRNPTMVGVRCEGSIHWTVYTSVTVHSQATVLVALRSMSRDTEVTASDFKVEARKVPGVASAYVSDPAALGGQRLGRAVTGGEPLTFDELAPANLIHRGQHVVLLAHVGGLEVRMSGIALGDGRASQRIKVQNESSQRVIEGIVLSANEVETPL
jgi:flagellar basal body P-ring formation protein FlgA